jgi:hypothetical protein
MRCKNIRFGLLGMTLFASGCLKAPPPLGPSPFATATSQPVTLGCVPLAHVTLVACSGPPICSTPLGNGLSIINVNNASSVVRTQAQLQALYRGRYERRKYGILLKYFTNPLQALAGFSGLVAGH